LETLLEFCEEKERKWAPAQQVKKKETGLILMVQTSQFNKMERMEQLQK